MPSKASLVEESTRATELIRGKVVARVVRNRPSEVLVEFTDGTRMFVDQTEGALELSITEGRTP